MKQEIEMLDRRRMTYLAWQLVGSVGSVVLSVIRFFFRLKGLNAQPIGVAVLVGLVLCVAVLAVCTIGFANVGRQAKRDPAIKEALDNELVRSLGVESWKGAFLGSIGSMLFFALVWFVYPVCDPVMAALTSIIAGAAVYHATFYFRYRSS